MLEERFTDRARKVMVLANQEAQRLNHEYLGPEHILLGLIKEGSGVAATVLKNHNVDLLKARIEVEKLIRIGPKMVTMRRLLQTPRAKKVIEYANIFLQQAQEQVLGAHVIVIQVAGLFDAEIFRKLNLKSDEIRQGVIEFLYIGKTDIDHSVESQWERPTWDEYFMLEATTALSRSPDPSTKHGAVIVNHRKRPVGQGYNGFPSGGDESVYPTTRPDKYVFIIHAEANAILNCTFPPEECTLYVTGIPCNNCMKYIIQAGIRRVVYGKIGSDMVDTEETKRTMMMADNHGVEMVEYNESVSPYQWHLRVAGYLKGKGWE
jgi:deoxycytidylate deaminase